jgi:flagellar basal-body rod protein FlgB
MLIHNSLYRHTAIPAAERSLDAAALRTRAIAANMANLTTPGYERIEVAFESVLRAKLKSIGEDGKPLDQKRESAREVFEQVEPVAFRPQDLAKPGEINNVNIDYEAAKLAENQLAFQAAVQAIKGQKGLLDSAIKGYAQP